MKLKKAVFITIASIFIFAGRVFAEDAAPFDKEAFIDSAEKNKKIELSLKDCIILSLKNNSELKIKRIEPIIAKTKIKKAEGAFEPSLYGNYEYDETTMPGAMPVLTGKTEDRSRRNDFNLGIEGKTFTNTKYDIYWNNDTYSSNSRLQRFFPNFESSLNGTITQPVLKDLFGMGEDQANIIIAKQNKETQDYAFINEGINTVTRVKSVYYDYIARVEQYKVSEISLESAKTLEKIIKERYEKGLASSADVFESDAALARTEERLLFFEKELKKTEDELKLVTNLVDDPELWNAVIHPTDRLELETKKIDLVDDINEAFRERMDYKIAGIDLKTKDINIKTTRNSLLPTVDVVGTYAANGLSDKYTSAIDQIGDGSYGSWSIGVDVSVPLGFSKEISDYKISKLEKKKAIIAFSRLEQNIILEVRNAVRSADISNRNIKAALKGLDAEKKTYEAAKARYREGLLSTKDMLDYQRDLDLENLNYIQAMVEYNKALLDLAKTKGVTLKENNIVLE